VVLLAASLYRLEVQLRQIDSPLALLELNAAWAEFLLRFGLYRAAAPPCAPFSFHVR
jgi:hypothetical protein